MSTEPRSVAWHVFADEHAAACAVVDALAATLSACRARDHEAALALPTGRTPVPVYAELLRRIEAGVLSLQGCRLFALDEYHPLSPEHPASFVRFLRERLLDQLDLGAGAVQLLDGLCPDADVAAHCAAYEQALAEAGGLDLALLGLGTNGHVAFNEPGAAPAGRTARVALAEETRRGAAPAFGGLAHVPTHGLSMGLGTLASARRVIVLATGAGKAAIVARVLADVEAALPATQVLRASDGLLLLDAAAAAGVAGR